MRSKVRSALLLLPLMLGPAAAPAHTAEIDSFTGRETELRDATARLDRWANARLREGVERANATAPGCDAYELHRQLRDALAFPFVGHGIAEELAELEGLDARRVPFEESIYRDLGLLEAVSVHWKKLSPVVRVGDAVIGVDKIGHFFVEGWRYYEIAAEEGEGLAAAMAWGESVERSYFGLLTTGIYSYADLVANLEGLRFWSHLLAEGPEPLPAAEGADPPYVACVRGGEAGRGSWRLRRELDLADYVSPAWDEAVNCCRYRSEEIAGKVRRHVAALGEDARCPVDAAACADARDRYGALAERLLHPRCLAAERPWWHFLWPGNWGLLR